MPQLELDAVELPPQSDPARHFDDAEPWTRVWRYRFVPPCHLHGLNVTADPGLERLIYLQSLISDEITTAAAD